MSSPTFSGYPRYPRPPQIGQIRAAVAGVIEASAGTGKTFLLEHLVVDLVLGGHPLEKILVVTFTDKATGELQRRVRQTLHTLLAVAEGAAAPPGDLGANPWILDGTAQHRLRVALGAMDRASLSTIHGFCQRVLTEHAFAQGRLFDQELVDGPGAFRRAFREGLRRDLATTAPAADFLETYLAGDKSVGKLESLLWKVISKIGSGAGVPLVPPFAPERLLRALASVAAQPENADLFRSGGNGKGMRAATQTALRERLRRLRATAAMTTSHRHLPGALRDLDEHERDRRGLFTYLSKEAGTEPDGGDFAPAWCTALREVRAAAVPFEAALVTVMLPPLLERLRAHKRQAGQFDFQDMLALVDEGLHGPGGEELVEQLRRRFSAALIDEFQDTDDMQWRIFRRIFLDSGGKNLLYVIGDPKQAIYGFRGADVQTYLAARKAIGQLGGSAAVLEQNFRSTADLVAACNQIFADAGPAAFFTGEVRYDHPVDCGHPERRLLDDAGQAVRPVQILSVPPSPEGPLPSRQVRSLLYQAVVDEIAAMLARPWRWSDQERPLGPGDIQVLTRSIEEARQIGETLRQAGIPHAHHKLDGLFTSDEARAVRDLLNAILDPRDRATRLRALLTPFFGWHLRDLPARTDAEGPSDPVLARLLDWKALADRRDYDRLFARILDDSGLLRRQLFVGDDGRSVTNIVQIFERLLEEAALGRPALADLNLILSSFIEEHRVPPGENADLQRIETDKEAVAILTMHKSKGLEAAVVFVLGGTGRNGVPDVARAYHRDGKRHVLVGRSRDPQIEAALKAEESDEERRLLYVALTRAKGRLVLPYFPVLPDAVSAGKAPRALRRLDGMYRHLNQRLDHLLESPAFRALCDIRPVAGRRTLPKPDRWELPRWAPPLSLLQAPADTGRLRTLREERLGPLVTSYSQMKRHEETLVVPLDKISRRWEERDEAPADDESPRPPDDLPGGAAMGVLLHEALETISLTSLANGPALGSWIARDDVRAFFDDWMDRAGLEGRHRGACERLVHHALTRPLPGGGTRRLPGVADLARPPLREVEILYPITHGGYPDYIKGIVDVFLEHEGLLYALDWKSDRIPPARDSAAGLAQHVQEHYDLQIRLYALGMVRILGVQTEETYQARFGGLHYLFLRQALRTDGGEAAGVVFVRPTWEEIQRWQQELARDPRIARLRVA